MMTSTILTILENIEKLSIYHKINWDNRLIGIRGPKGAGKVLRLILKKCGDLGHGESLR